MTLQHYSGSWLACKAGVEVRECYGTHRGVYYSFMVKHPVSLIEHEAPARCRRRAPPPRRVQEPQRVESLVVTIKQPMHHSAAAGSMYTSGQISCS